MSLIGKLAPDMAAVVAMKPEVKTSMKKLFEPKKATVICFVAKTLSPVESSVAVARMEEAKFQVKDKAVFIVVSLDSVKAAQELHHEAAIKTCAHVFSSSGGKEYGVVRTPCHVVIGADGKVKLQSEEDVVDYLTLVQ